MSRVAAKGNEAIQLILHYGKGLQQTPSGHWAYFGHVLYDFIALRAIKGVQMRPLADKFMEGISKEMIEGMIALEVSIYRKEVLDCIRPTIELLDHELEALVSLSHHIGMSNFTHCKTVKLINEGKDKSMAADFITYWNKINVQGYSHKALFDKKETLEISPAFVARRKSEKQLFLNGELILN